METEGLRRLRAWITARGLSQSEFARCVQLKQQSVSQILAGKVTPSSGVLHAIEELTGIPTEEWLSSDELARVEYARAQRTEAA